MHRFHLPFPPSVNHYWRHVGKMVLISKGGRKYRKDVIAIVGKGFATLAGRLQVEVHCYPPDKRRRDLDNLLKSLLDSLQAAGVFADDGQIDSLIISRHSKVDEGMVVVSVKEIQAELEPA